DPNVRNAVCILPHVLLFHGTKDLSIQPDARMWDVHAARIDLIVSDAKGDLMHCTARAVQHRSLFYAVERRGDLLHEELYCFQLVEIDALEPTNNRYLIDVTGYVTNVGRTTQTRTGSKTLDFYLANWPANKSDVVGGGFGDMLIQKRTRHVGLYTVIITAMSVKLYNNMLYSSSTSPTLIIDDEKIFLLKQMKTDDSGVDLTKGILPADNAVPKVGTLKNLLMWAQNWKYDVKIDKVRTKKGWNYPSCGGEKCKKGTLNRKEGRFWCDSSSVEYPVMRYRLELEISNDIAEVVVVMFDEMDEEDHLGLPTTLANIKVVTAEDGEGREKGASSSMFAANEASKESVLKRVSKTPQVWICYAREGVEYSDAEGSFVADSLPKIGDAACSSDMRKRKSLQLLDLGTKLESIMVCFALLPLEPGSTIRLTWQNEIKNKLGAFIKQETGEGAYGTIVGSLIEMLDQNSSIAKAFRMARDWCHSHTFVDVELRMISKRTNSRQYNAPTIVEVSTLITNDFGDGAPTRDIIISNNDSGSQRILELHPSYMGYVKMKEYYAYVIQYSKEQGTTLLRGGRLFQQYLVDAYTAIKEQRLSGPRYMMQNYQDAMALCCVYGNPDLFITFTSNPKWPEINEMLAYVPGQRAIIGQK
ncbi:ATP-dependent DNA helicase PIF1-like protein, partial [Tanacetum coccineum]